MKRCKSKSPVHDLRCELERSHGKANPRSLHKSGDVVWGNDGTHHCGTPLLDLLFAEDRFDKGTEPTFVAFDEAAAFGESMAAADPEQQLIDWWMGKAASECEQTVEKAIEYGATDLIDIGTMLARTMRREVDEEEAAELGVFFYLIGKIARWQSAIERGDRPSDDTLLDIGVYVRMAQRIRDSGGWPGVEMPNRD